MSEPTDSELLGQYARAGSESAFDTLVRRHIDFVYSAALRMTADRHLAEDVTQAVFMTLSSRARSLSHRAIISGWLHRTARNLAAKTVRTEVRRRLREQRAAELPTSDHEPDWNEIAPVLDSALAELSDTDRDVVLLRFFERKTAAQIGAALKLSEEAAQKRVTRALEKLRSLFAREGISVSGVALTVVLGAQAVEAAPLTLAASVSGAALAAAPAAGTMTFSILKGITMTKLQAGALSALLVFGAATPFLLHHRSINTLRQQNRSLRAQLDANAMLRSQTEALSNKLAAVQQSQALSKAQMAELMRLRSEVGLLRRDSQELARLRAEQAKRSHPEAVENAPVPNPFLPADSWANVGADNPEGALQTFLWAGKYQDTNLVADLIRVQRDPQVPESDELDQQFARGMVSATSWLSGSLQAFRVLSQDVDGDGMTRLGIELIDEKGKTTAHNIRFVREENQWYPVMHVWLQDKGSIRAALDMPNKFRAE